MNRRAPILLLIEPDAIQSLTLARALKRGGGYNVIPVRGADDALETFVAHHMDIALVVADTQSATFAGSSLVEELHGIDPWVPVIAMSPAAAAIDAAADECSNVSATLTKPVAPDDLVTHVERVLQSLGTRDLHSLSPTPDTSVASDDHVLTASATPTTPTVCDWVGVSADASFCWPPTDTELDEIQVVDTQSDGPWQLDLRPRAAIAPVPLTGRSARRELATAPAPIPPLRIVVRPFDGPVKRRFQLTADRWFEVAAAAVCCLALTTLWAVSGGSMKPAARADNTSARAASPMLSVRRAHAGVMPLVPAIRVSSRFDRRTRPSDALLKSERREIQPEPERPAIAVTNRPVTHEERIPDVPDVPALETRTADAAAVPLPLVAARPPAPPAPPVEMAEARVEPAATATRDVAASANARPPAVNRPREDERDIYQVLQQYERAYERLDVAAARAVMPSLNTQALARAFGGLKEQALEFSHCRVAVESLEATAVCGGRASYVPRVGSQATRTEQREWTFRLRKVDHDWLIAKAEVR